MLKNGNRLFRTLPSKIWIDWRSELIFVKPESVTRWSKRKFQEFWRIKSRLRLGRPAIAKEHIAFIRRISSDHPEYGEDRIAQELEAKFGIHQTLPETRAWALSLCICMIPLSYFLGIFGVLISYLDIASTTHAVLGSGRAADGIILIHENMMSQLPHRYLLRSRHRLAVEALRFPNSCQIQKQ